MRSRQPFGHSRKQLIALLALFAMVSFLAFLRWRQVANVQPATSGSTVLVLDDCDSDYKNPPFEDAVKTFGRHAELICNSRRLRSNLQKFHCCALATRKSRKT